MKQKQKEIWKPCRHINDDGTVLDFTGLYEVSNLGRVRSLNYRRTGKTKVLSPFTFECKDGSILYTVCIYKDGKLYKKSIHRLALSSFDQEGWFLGADVDHIEARSSTSCDNRLSNLRWFTRQQNNSTDHCKELQSRTLTNRKDLSKRVKAIDLTTGEVTEYPSAMEVGRSLGIPPATVSNRIKNCNGFYKKMNLQFSYID